MSDLEPFQITVKTAKLGEIEVRTSILDLGSRLAASAKGNPYILLAWDAENFDKAKITSNITDLHAISELLISMGLFLRGASSEL